jgi:hypothetical protein
MHYTGLKSITDLFILLLKKKKQQSKNQLLQWQREDFVKFIHSLKQWKCRLNNWNQLFHNLLALAKATEQIEKLPIHENLLSSMRW